MRFRNHKIWTALRWGILLIASLALSRLFQVLGIPAAPLFAAMLAGILQASWTTVPYGRGFPRAGQALLGLEIGLLFSKQAMAIILRHWAPILLISAATLLLSLAIGVLFSRWQKVDSSTGLLGMTAGGAAGITAIAQELGAETGLVAILQYLRVVLVMLSLPLVALLIFARPIQDATGLHTVHASWSGSVVLLICAAAAVWIAKRIHLTTPYLLGPLFVSLALTASQHSPTPALPRSLLLLAYLLIGWQAGLQLSLARLRAYLRLLPHALALIVALNLLCALLGILLAQLVGVSDLDGYLATAPGALYAAVAVSMATHGNVLFVLGAHLARLLMMLIIMPPLAQRLRRKRTVE
ncbi:AbrB family transcriptional regulator [Acidithiobacillus sp. AMEEHan]|uniref:AbrB family transcriptional regulator n=1 Tax=Acidithiobacillus sp. AMEEHan TaxID=2994951 RepID=UPI0027E50CD3|nr:AbrB family transcriptional regulator [Acidithiobacillus sp. AMEEHan]